MGNRLADHVSIRELKRQMIFLAAEIVRCTNMPSEHRDDWKWYATTPMAERRKVLKAAERANDQCREWAIRLRGISDKLGDLADG